MTIYYLPPSLSCEACNFSAQLVKNGYIVINLILLGIKIALKNFPLIKREPKPQYFCSQSHYLNVSNRNKANLMAQRGQKRQADKLLSDTAKSLPEIAIGDNIGVPIPKEDRGKLGQSHIWE